MSARNAGRQALAAQIAAAAPPTYPPSKRRPWIVPERPTGVALGRHMFDAEHSYGGPIDGAVAAVLGFDGADPTENAAPYDPMLPSEMWVNEYERREGR